jgi:hypothetical protein
VRVGAYPLGEARRAANDLPDFTDAGVSQQFVCGDEIHGSSNPVRVPKEWRWT